MTEAGSWNLPRGGCAAEKVQAENTLSACLDARGTALTVMRTTCAMGQRFVILLFVREALRPGLVEKGL